MSDKPAEKETPAPAPPESETAQPHQEMTRAERIFVRINIVQTVLAVAGVFTGAVALYAALNESAAVRRQSEAAVWPIIQLHTSDFITADAAEFRISMRNTGVGPGRMESMRVLIDGAAARDWLHAAELAVGETAVRFSKSSVDRRVIAAGETVDLFAVADRNIVAAMTEKAATGAAQIDYCYCSIFDACWLFESATEETSRVATCPDYGAQQFQE
ncbi:MAG: hypothetical protein AAFW81_08275 [Pseudomonadota bacterium]